MNTKFKTILVASLLVGTGALAGCHFGDDSSSRHSPPQASAESFTGFVKAQLKKPGDATPAKINGIDFKFSDRDNPDAYNDVLPSSSSN